jgi:two-component system, response regulator / RNA-binding antiterminator
VKVLLADDDAERASLLAKVLEADPGLVVARTRAGELLLDAVATHAPDVVIVDMARPDRDALEGVRQLASRSPRPVVVFVDEDDPGFMEAAIGAGVSSYNVLGLPPPDVKPILRAAVALFRRHHQTREELGRAEKKLGEREVIDRAKAILIRERRLAEPAAYAWLRRQARARGRRIVEIAEDIVRERERERDAS